MGDGDGPSDGSGVGGGVGSVEGGLVSPMTVIFSDCVDTSTPSKRLTSASKLESLMALTTDEAAPDVLSRRSPSTKNEWT